MKKVDYHPRSVRVFLSLLLLVILAVALRSHRLGALSGHAALLALPILAIAWMMVFPRVFFPLYKAILVASGFLGNLVFAVIATVVFYLVLTPISLGMRLCGKRFLPAAPDPSLPTYYDEPETGHGCERQF